MAAGEIFTQKVILQPSCAPYLQNRKNINLTKIKVKIDLHFLLVFSFLLRIKKQSIYSSFLNYKYYLCE